MSTDRELTQGAMSIGAKGINNLGGLVAFRFCLGLVEAGESSFSTGFTTLANGRACRFFPGCYAPLELLV